MSSLEDLLGVDLSSPSQRLALELAENDAYLLRDLVQVRIERGLNQKDVGDLLGVSQSTISTFESHDNDPKLSTVRRYAHAIGALISHSVADYRGGQIGYDGWQFAGASVTRGQFRGRSQPARVIRTDWEPDRVALHA
jgi:DNA-binding XRE family transcriptional regulator